MTDLITSARFVVVREQPLLVVDIEGTMPQLPLIEDGIYRRVVDAGLLELRSFYGVNLPRGARVGWSLDASDLRLIDEQDAPLLKVPRSSVDPVWEAASLRMKGTMFCVGFNLGLHADQTPQELCDALDVGARETRLAGAIVGVAEPRTGLPLFF